MVVVVQAVPSVVDADIRQAPMAAMTGPVRRHQHIAPAERAVF